MAPDKEAANAAGIGADCIVAIIGFSGYFCWDLAGVFVPATKLVPFLSAPEMAFTRIPLLVALLASMLLALYKADWCFDNRFAVFPVAISFSFVSVAIAVLDHLLAGNLPLFVQMLSSLAFGIGQGGFFLFWAVYFSLISTRYTPVIIILSSCLGTSFFVLASNLASPYLSLSFNAFIIFCSLLSCTFLLRRIPPTAVLPTSEFKKLPLFTLPSAMSVGAHNLAYGFTTITLFQLGPTATLIGCSTGIIGSAFCLLYYRLASRMTPNPPTGILQRLTLPPIIIGLLLLPYVDDVGKLICCCALNIALSHFVVVGWVNTTTFNSALQLHPVSSSALSRIPGWSGFLLGVVFASCIYFVIPATGVLYQLAIIIIITAITLASALYGMDDSQIKKRLAIILAKENSSQDGQAAKKPLPYFKESCRQIIERYNISPREGDVFFYLARGRNAEYISEKLFLSGATVKTHIYHIYQKMGINSQRHLMDAVESAWLGERRAERQNETASDLPSAEN